MRVQTLLPNALKAEPELMKRSNFLNVCVVADTFPKLSETFIWGQVEGLRRAGVDVTVIADRVAEPIETTRAMDVRQRWGAASQMEPWLRRLPPNLSDRGVTLLDQLFAQKLLGFDAIIAHFGMNGVRVARTGHRTPNFPPLITIFHGFDVGMAARDGTLGQYRPLFSHPGLLLTVNKVFRSILIDSGAPPDRTRVHHLGIRPETIPFRHRSWSDPIRFLSVGRLTEKKGTEIGLRALARLQDDAANRDWRYDIIGDGELRGELEVLTHQLGLTDRVRFLGAQPHSIVRNAMDEADSFLLPSRTAATGDKEGIPIVLMEAMSAGLLVVSTRHSGIPELVRDGETGILADEGDVEDLAEALRKVFEKREALAPLAEAARRTVETEFHADRESSELVEWIEDLAKTRKRS